MVDFLINMELHQNSTYQQQIREKLVELIEQDAFLFSSDVFLQEPSGASAIFFVGASQQ